MKQIKNKDTQSWKQMQSIQRKNKIQPGSEDWFKLWFSRPYLTGAGFRGRKKK